MRAKREQAAAPARLRLEAAAVGEAVVSVKSAEVEAKSLAAVELALVEGKVEVALAPAKRSVFGATAGDEMEAVALWGSLWLARSKD